MSRDDNVAVFENTAKLCKENQKLKENIDRAIKGQKLILENDSIENIEKNIYEEPAKLIVSKKRSFEAAEGYKDFKVCVHNFASASNPGGGVTNGANAQEECLCRCSTLYPCLSTREMFYGFYAPHRKEKNPLHNDDMIYTPNITVFKTDTSAPKLMDEKDWYDVSVITCAAPNLRTYPSNAYNTGDGDKAVKITDKDLLALHEKRLRRILDVAVMEGNEVVILGAFGCGAFSNNPRVVAQAAKNVIKEYRQAFKVIEFAVYCSGRDEENYKVFAGMIK